MLQSQGKMTKIMAANQGIHIAEGDTQEYVVSEVTVVCFTAKDHLSHCVIAHLWSFKQHSFPITY